MTTRTRRTRQAPDQPPSPQTLAGSGAKVGDVVLLAGMPSGPYIVRAIVGDSYAIELMRGLAGIRWAGGRTVLADGRFSTRVEKLTWTHHRAV